MVVIINNSIVNNLIKNKDVRSESVDSFSSTIDVHAPFGQSKQADADQLASASERFDLVDSAVGTKFDLLLPPNHRPTQQEQLLRDSLSSILVLNSTSRPEVQTLLDSYNGHLIDVGSHLLEGLRHSAPSQLAARVGDYNENLFYEMRDMDQDIGSIIQSSETSAHGSGYDECIQQDIQSFDTSIRQSLRHTNLSYRGSFMQTEQTMYQPAHVDYDYPILQSYGKQLFLAFFPLTEEGAYLQLWQDPMKSNDGDKSIVEGTVVYIPYGKMFLVPSDTIHGGGFKRGSGGNLRFHLYIALEDDHDDTEEDISLLHHPMNKYTEEHDRRRELCERFVDAKGLESLLYKFFDV